MKRRYYAMLIGTTALMPFVAVAQTANQAAAPGQQQGASAATQPGEARPITAGTLRNQPIYNQSGQEFGRITSVLQGGNNQIFAVVTAAGNRQVLVPVERVAQENNRYVLRGYNDEQLRALTEYREGVGGYRPADPNQRINIAQAQGQQMAEAETSRIIVQQPAPAVRVDQAAPQVAVQQQPPSVTVRQPNPEILVRQPAPTVTVDIPQPEIIVRMPRPDVDVAMAQPQVQVRQSQPQVQVAQPQAQPQVQVQPAQPQVMVRQAENQPQVNVQQAGQPQVRYERAEPRVTVNQAQGQPQVRFEQIEGNRGQQAQATEPGQQGAVRTEQQRRAYQERFGGDVEATSAVGAGAARAVRIGDLDDMDVYNARGERLGEVDRIVFNPADNRRYVIVAHGGFLGLGEDRVAFPIERFAVRGNDRLVIRGVTEQDIDAMDNWRNQVANYRNLQENEQVRLPAVQ